jgi:hypothetical protein
MRPVPVKRRGKPTNHPSRHSRERARGNCGTISRPTFTPGAVKRAGFFFAYSAPSTSSVRRVPPPRYALEPRHDQHTARTGDPDDPGGCYAGGGNVALHWRGLSERAETSETDAENVGRFAAGLPPFSILRHHIAGDLGRAPGAAL